MNNNNKNKITKKDLQGEIENFPLEVVQEMCDEQVRQGNNFNPKVFQINKYTDCFRGGFNWDNSNFRYWYEVINKNKFELLLNTLVNNIKITQKQINKKDMILYKNFNLGNRVITLCAEYIDNKTIQVGYSVKLPEDVVNIELGRSIARGRAAKKPLKTFDITSGVDKTLLYAILDSVFYKIDKGEIIIKGIK